MEKLWIKNSPKNINNLTKNNVFFYLIKKYINKRYFLLAIVELSFIMYKRYMNISALPHITRWFFLLLLS